MRKLIPQSLYSSSSQKPHQFGTKNKIAKNMGTLRLESLSNCSMQKTDLKNR